MVCLQWTTSTKKSLFTSSQPLSAEGALVTKRPFPFLLAPRTLVKSTARSALVLHLKLAFPFN